MVQKRTLQGKSIRDLASRRPSDGQLLNKGKEKTNNKCTYSQPHPFARARRCCINAKFARTMTYMTEYICTELHKEPSREK
jgi:hypothetical protein